MAGKIETGWRGNLSPEQEEILPPRLVGLTPLHRQYLEDTTQFIIVAAGRRSRKTLISQKKLFHAALHHDNHGGGKGRYFAAAPTSAQAERIFWGNLVRWFKPWTVKALISKKQIHLRNGTQIHIMSLDKADRIEGSPWNGGIITEAASLKPKIWKENIRPVFTDTDGWCILEGVPEGRNWFFDLALRASGGAMAEVKTGIGVRAQSKDLPKWVFYAWHSADTLGEEKDAELQEEYDERTYRQEFRAEFLAFGGLLYYQFDRERHVRPTPIRKKEPIYLTCDFNKAPMVLLACQKVPRISTRTDKSGREHRY